MLQCIRHVVVIVHDATFLRLRPECLHMTRKQAICAVRSGLNDGRTYGCVIALNPISPVPNCRFSSLASLTTAANVVPRDDIVQRIGLEGGMTPVLSRQHVTTFNTIHHAIFSSGRSAGRAMMPAAGYRLFDECGDTAVIVCRLSIRAMNAPPAGGAGGRKNKLVR